jgi:hypothetical protein
MPPALGFSVIAQFTIISETNHHNSLYIYYSPLQNMLIFSTIGIVYSSLKHQRAMQ